MKVVFVSNFLNHHQEPLAKEFLAMPGVEFNFIATSSLPEERAKLGYLKYTQEYCPYLRENKKNELECQEIINNADLVIIGSAPYELIKKRLESGKITFIYTERLFKNIIQTLKVFLNGNWKRIYVNTGKYKNAYALCSSSYVKKDFNIIKAFPNKMFKWGYFPELNTPSINKMNKPIKVLWVGRMLNWKNPNHAVIVAEHLRKRHIEFEMHFIGIGPQEDKLRTSIYKRNLDRFCTLHGSMSPEEVRENMELADIFLFTSGYGEGWGAVLNEAMNSACCCIANTRAGATNYLIKNGATGYVYNNSTNDLIKKVDLIIDDFQAINEIKSNARDCIAEMWNARIAANRLIEAYNYIVDGKDPFLLYKCGPMSKA